MYIPNYDLFMRDCFDDSPGFKEYEGKKAADDEIKVGDELQNSKTKEKGIVVFCKDLCSYPTYCLFGNSGVFSIEGEMLEHWQKTGRHFPQVAELLKEMGE